jgi:hypothetical protein
MKFTIHVPATVEMVIEVKAENIFEARELWNQGEFEIISENTYDHDYDWSNIKAKIDPKEQDIQNAQIELKSLNEQLKIREKFLVKYADKEFQGEGGVIQKGAVSVKVPNVTVADIRVTIPK